MRNWSEYDIPYSMLSSLTNDQHFHKLVRVDIGDFYFSKFSKIFTKSATGGLFDYYDIVSK